MRRNPAGKIWYTHVENDSIHMSVVDAAAKYTSWEERSTYVSAFRNWASVGSLEVS